MYWSDFVDDRRDHTWLGLLSSAGKGEVSLRPSLRMEAGGRRLMRLMAGDSPLLWARIAPDYYGYWYIVARDETVSRRIIPPIRFNDAREGMQPSGSATWYRGWARYFATELQRSVRGPICIGRMFLGRAEAFLGDGGWPRDGRLRIPPVTELARVPTLPSHGFSDWDFGDDLAPLPLRPFANESNGRVKAFRKLVRENRLPPILLIWMSGLQRYLILDGHDRLVASLLEGKAPHCLALLEISEQSSQRDQQKVDAVVSEVARHLDPLRMIETTHRPRHGLSVDQANRLLIDVFDDRPSIFVRTRARPLEGGEARWVSEVRQELIRVESGDFEMVA